VAAVRDAAGPRVALRIDANGAWDVDTAIAMINAMEPYGIELVEQPVAAADVAGLRRVRDAVSVPVAADEAVTDAASAERLLAEGAADVLVVKPAVVGGLREARRIIELASVYGADAVVTSAFEAGPGVAAALHLAATLPRPARACGLATLELLADDLIERGPPVVDGRMVVPSGAGAGVTIDRAALARHGGAPLMVGV
jgi:O-succinylbenzoate synthase